MIPTWMIEDLERLRQERQEERPQLHIELPRRRDEELPAVPAPSSIIVIEFGDPASAD